MSSKVLEMLVDDVTKFTWRDLALCKNLEDPDILFEGYEGDPQLAAAVDEMCLSCPVARECNAYGIETKSWGQWGGWYLAAGKISKQYNAHKDTLVVERLAKIHD